ADPPAGSAAVPLPHADPRPVRGGRLGAPRRGCARHVRLERRGFDPGALRFTIVVMDHEETVCPNCQKVTKTVVGGCPNCGCPKEESAYFPPEVAASESWFDDLP